MTAGLCIDLNADLGEGERWDERLLDIVSSCNVACGGHAGDDGSMARTVSLAAQRGVAVGAHPSYPDREGFGRRSGFLAGEALRASLDEQIVRLATHCREQGVELCHLKPHGALYNDAASDPALAALLADLALSHGLTLVGLPASEVSKAAGQTAVTFVREAFVDRRYLSNARLAPRSRSDALLDSPAEAAAQALSIVTRGRVRSADGQCVDVAADTLCLHGDTAGADAIAEAVQQVLQQRGIDIRPAARA